MVTYILNPRSWWNSVSSVSVWSKKQVPGHPKLHIEMLSQEKVAQCWSWGYISDRMLDIMYRVLGSIPSTVTTQKLLADFKFCLNFLVVWFSTSCWNSFHFHVHNIRSFIPTSADYILYCFEPELRKRSMRWRRLVSSQWSLVLCKSRQSWPWETALGHGELKGVVGATLVQQVNDYKFHRFFFNRSIPWMEISLCFLDVITQRGPKKMR